MIHTTLHEADITVVRPSVDRLTAANSKTFKDEIVALIDGGSTQLVIDFSKVSFLDSSGLGALVGILKKIGVRGELAVSGLSPDVSQLFKICRMDRVFNIYPSVELAVQAVSEH